MYILHYTICYKWQRVGWDLFAAFRINSQSSGTIGSPNEFYEYPEKVQTAFDKYATWMCWMCWKRVVQVWNTQLSLDLTNYNIADNEMIHIYVADTDEKQEVWQKYYKHRNNKFTTTKMLTLALRNNKLCVIVNIWILKTMKFVQKMSRQTTLLTHQISNS